MKKILAVLFAAALLVAFTVPAMAKTYLGGIVFQEVNYYKNEVTNDEDPTGADSDFDTIYWDLAVFSRFKARLTNEDNVGLFVEFGLGGRTGFGNLTYLRHLYGWWDVNPQFRILAGQTSLPISPLAPDTVVGHMAGGHVVGNGWGNYDQTRSPQIRFQWKLEDLGFVRLVFSDPHEMAAPAALGAAADNDSKLPRIDLGVPLYFGPIKVYPSLFYHKQTFDDVASGQEDTFTAWGASLGVKFGFGPLMIAAEVNTGENWSYSRDSHGAVAPYYNGATGDLTDTDDLSYWIDVSFKLGKITPHLIYGALKSEVDPSGTANDFERDRTMYGITARIPLAKGFMLRPELMFYDWEDEIAGVDMDHGKETVAGVMFQIAF